MILRRLALSTLAILGACSDAGGDTPLFTAERALVATEALLPVAEIDAGTEIEARCLAVWSDDTRTPLEPATLEMGPGAVIEGLRFTIDRAGTYAVHCRASTAVESRPATLIVRAASLAQLTAALSPPTIAVGEEAEGRCDAADAFGNPRTGDPTIVRSTSPGGAPVSGSRVRGGIPGTYGVGCTSGRIASADAPLTVVPGAPVRLFATLDRYEVRAGERVTVTCQAEDVGGNRVTVTAGIRSDVASAMIDPTGLTPSEARIHAVSCAIGPLESAPAELTVRPGLPVSLDIVEVRPVKAVYARSDLVELAVHMLDAFGNTVPAATIEVSATPALAAIAQGNAQAILLGNGPIPLTARVTSPTHDGRVVEDTTTVTVDGSPPELIIDYPERAAIIAAAPGQALTIRGRVTDALSGVTSLSVGGVPVAIGRGGAFSAQYTPSWGINVIEATAIDDVGNTRALSQAFELASRFRRAGPNRVSTARIDDGILLRIGRAALDDNNADVDDLATIARLAVERIDVASLIPSPVTSFHSDCSIPFVDITGDLRLHVDGVRYASPSFDFTPIAGGLRLRVEITNVQVDVRTTGDVCEIGMGLRGSARANRIVVTSDLLVSAAGGQASVRVSTQNVSISGLSINLALPSIIDWAVDGIINLFSGAIADELEDAFGDVIASEVPPVIEQFLESVAVATGFDVPPPLGLHLDVDARLGTIAFDTQGGSTGQATTVYAAGAFAPEPLGAILEERRVAATFDPARALGVGIAYDLANQALYALWYGGGLHFDVPESLFPSQMSGGVQARANLEAKLPPVVRASGDPAFPLELQAGELELDVDLSGITGLPPIRATLHAAFVARAGVTVDAQGQIQLALAPNPIISLDFDSSLDGVVDMVAFTQSLESMLSTLVPQVIGHVLRGIPLPTFDLSQLAGSYLPPGIVLGIGQPAIRVQPSYLVLEGSVVRLP